MNAAVGFATHAPAAIHEAVTDALCAMFPTMSRKALAGRCRGEQATAWLRQVAVFVAMERLGLAVNDAVDLFRRDRATLSHSRILVGMKLERHPAAADLVDLIEGHARAALSNPTHFENFA